MTTKLFNPPNIDLTENQILTQESIEITLEIMDDIYNDLTPVLINKDYSKKAASHKENILKSKLKLQEIVDALDDLYKRL